MGNRVFRPGDMMKVAIPHSDVLKHCRPIYRKLPGWMSDSTRITDPNDLPKNMLHLVRDVLSYTGTRVHTLSVGPKRDQTIVL